MIAELVGTAAPNAASVPPRQLARPVSIVPNIPGIPGPPISSSGSVSPSGLPVHSEAKMVSVQRVPAAFRLRWPLQEGFFPLAFAKSRSEIRLECCSVLGSGVGGAAALACRVGTRCCWDAAQPGVVCAELLPASKVTDGLEVGLGMAEPRAGMLCCNLRVWVMGFVQSLRLKVCEEKNTSILEQRAAKPRCFLVRTGGGGYRSASWQRCAVPRCHLNATTKCVQGSRAELHHG